MEITSKVMLKDSITMKLLTVVFSFYLIITFLLTMSHIVAEYFDTKDTIIQDMEASQATFELGLSRAIWTGNDKQLRSLVEGIERIPYIVGVEVNSDVLGKLSATSESMVDASGLFRYQAPLYYVDRLDGRLPVGDITLISSREVVWQRIQNGFMFIIGSAILKTLALWTIFLWVGRILLSRPLHELTAAAEQVDLDNLEHLNIDVKTSGHNELKILEIAFNSMVRKLHAATTQLQQLNQGLEAKVKDRTQAAEAAQQKAETANRAKSVFLSNMSHELRTPLSGILSATQLMARDPALFSEQKKTLMVISRSGNHLLNLINDVLEMSKIEAGKTTASFSAFNFHNLLISLYEMFQVRCEKKGIELKLEQEPSVPQFVQTDEKKLRQILINLLGNALKFTQHGFIQLQVNPTFNPATSKNTKSDICIRFKVMDSGSGIAEADQSSIFDAFVQTDESRIAQGGTGLGLSISQQFVKLMGGDLVVQSKLGEGSCFSFELPIQLATLEDVPMEIVRTRVTGLQSGQPPFRILVVDDHLESQGILLQLLKSLGFETQGGKNGLEAVEIFENWHPHLIWMDMRMPGMDGYAATKKIKALPGGAETIIIALTASAFEEDREHIFQTGCNDFLSKPFQVHTLLEKMVEHLHVKFNYSEDEAQEVPTTLPKNMMEFADTKGLSQEWVDRMRNAARMADSDTIIELIEAIQSSHEPLATLLRQKEESFEYEAIIDWVEKMSSSS